MRALLVSVGLAALVAASPALGTSTLSMPPDSWSRADLMDEPDAPQCRAQWVHGYAGERGHGYLFRDLVVPFAWPPDARPQAIQAWRITNLKAWVKREPVTAEFVTAVSTEHGREWVPMEMPTVLSAGDPVALRFVVPENSVFMMVGFDW